MIKAVKSLISPRKSLAHLSAVCHIGALGQQLQDQLHVAVTRCGIQVGLRGQHLWHTGQQARYATNTRHTSLRTMESMLSTSASGCSQAGTRSRGTRHLEKNPRDRPKRPSLTLVSLVSLLNTTRLRLRLPQTGNLLSKPALNPHAPAEHGTPGTLVSRGTITVYRRGTRSPRVPAGATARIRGQQSKGESSPLGKPVAPPRGIGRGDRKGRQKGEERGGP